MVLNKPILGWNSWNTFGTDISEKLIYEMTDVIVNEGYKDAGYEYIIIDDCWCLKERQNGKLIPDPAKFPNGMKVIGDYIHSKGLKFGMYSCAGVKTCAGYPSSYGYEYEDAKQFAEWGVDYLKYDYCNFPESGDTKNAYLTMAMALANCGRDIVFAACNWGKHDPAQWMRSRGAHTYRSTGDIHDNVKSYTDIFLGQQDNFNTHGANCFNDMDMMIVGMRGEGLVALGGCGTEEYQQHFAMWAFLGSPIILGADLRKVSAEDKAIMLNKNLIAINQDLGCRPSFSIVKYESDSHYLRARVLEGGKIAVAAFKVGPNKDNWYEALVSFADLGIPHGKRVKITNAITGEEMGIFDDGIVLDLKDHLSDVLVLEVVK